MEDHYAKDGSFSLLDQLGSNSVLWPGMLAARGRVVPMTSCPGGLRPPQKQALTFLLCYLSPHSLSTLTCPLEDIALCSTFPHLENMSSGCLYTPVLL